MVDATVLIVGCGPTGLIVAHEIAAPRHKLDNQQGHLRDVPKRSRCAVWRRHACSFACRRAGHECVHPRRLQFGPDAIRRSKIRRNP
jgi:hypothetical protein